MNTPLDFLPHHLRASARVDRSGEVAWPTSDAMAVVDAIAAAGLVVLGLDLRRYDADGGVFELAWSAFSAHLSASAAVEAHAAARYALERPDRPADLDWVLVTWTKPPL